MDQIEVGFPVFLAEGAERVGAVRDVREDGSSSMLRMPGSSRYR